jgi:hypothetical protein
MKGRGTQAFERGVEVLAGPVGPEDDAAEGGGAGAAPAAGGATNGRAGRGSGAEGSLLLEAAMLSPRV